MFSGVSNSNTYIQKQLKTAQRQSVLLPSVANNNNVATTGPVKHVTLSLKSQILSFSDGLERTVASTEKVDWRAVYNRTHSAQEGVFSLLSRQIDIQGAQAALLQEMPASNAPARLEMAQRAVQFALNAEDNPLKDLPRETLAGITYDESGAYTVAERYSAYREIESRDNAFWKFVSEEAKTESNINGSTSGHLLFSRTRLEVLATLHPAEKTANDDSESALQYELLSAARKGLKAPEPVTYENQLAPADTALAVISQRGETSWKNISLEWLSSQKDVQASISVGSLLALVDEPGTEPLAARIKPTVAASWISLSTNG